VSVRVGLTIEAAGLAARRWHDRPVTVPVLRGERTLLRPVLAKDRDSRQRFGFHADIERGYGVLRDSGPMTDEEADAWYAGLVRAAADRSRATWAIDVDGELAGLAFLQGIREVDAKARFAIGLLSPAVCGRGYGSEATRLVLAHAFGTMGLHRVDLRVLAFNQRAIAMYRRCGFVEEGLERDSCRMGPDWYDDVMMGILDHEFTHGPPARRR
jgi:[ribosomal protein S5]-alanine N-acetyltransferase